MLKVRNDLQALYASSVSLAYTQIIQKLQGASGLLCPLSAFHLLTLLSASKHFL